MSAPSYQRYTPAEVRAVLAMVRDCPERGDALASGLTACRAGKGDRPGEVTHEECVRCKAAVFDPKAPAPAHAHAPRPSAAETLDCIKAARSCLRRVTDGSCQYAQCKAGRGVNGKVSLIDCQACVKANQHLPGETVMVNISFVTTNTPAAVAAVLVDQATGQVWSPGQKSLVPGAGAADASIPLNAVGGPLSGLWVGQAEAPAGLMAAVLEDGRLAGHPSPVLPGAGAGQTGPVKAWVG